MEYKEESKTKVVYICSPYSGNTEMNTTNARIYCRYAVNNGCIPFAPHLLFPQFMNEETERLSVMHMDIAMLDRCDELWVFGNKVTVGMKQEILAAENKKMPIRYFTYELHEKGV